MKNRQNKKAIILAIISGISYLISMTIMTYLRCSWLQMFLFGILALVLPPALILFLMSKYSDQKMQNAKREEVSDAENTQRILEELEDLREKRKKQNV